MNFRSEFLRITAPKTSFKRTFEKVRAGLRLPLIQFGILGIALILILVLAETKVIPSSTAEAFDVICNVNGGGFTGQSGAIRLGIARALLEASADYRPILKRAGMLTRDPRSKERKKYGLKGARRAPQFSKR